MGYNKERYVRLKMAGYYTLFGIWYLVSHLPLWFLYAISSLASLILYHIIRYRRDVVRKNIEESYPDWTPQERRKTERRFYTHFCDIMVESVKYFSMSASETKKRMVMKGVELLEDSAARGKSCGIFLGHYANWEWISSLPLWIDSDKLLSTQLYHPLENLITDKLICYTRQRFGGVNIPVENSIRHIYRYKQMGKPIVVGFIADQAPYWTNIHYWTHFLNHPDTPVFTGAERIMRKFDMDIYYLDIRRKKRGYYECEFKRITTTPNETPLYSLTEQYTRMFEETINRAPAYWLWSHRRWKRTKTEWQQRKDAGLR